MVPKLLTPEQKESRMNLCADILNNIDTDPSLLDTVITCDDKIRKLCNEEDETSRHIILECPALTHWRYGLLGIENPQEAFPKEKSCERATKPHKGNKPIHMK
ncbi:hypothetical protein NQ318_012263 [Aromia moschata]|uniref:Uncharacterized protein n=1 Tax=Aromia moschata TaxID=1265417 RepID=A0AAV8XGK5_9CUCU|nr:hypothetical protein NQ318_012263 [Aromia moschata]